MQITGIELPCPICKFLRVSIRFVPIDGRVVVMAHCLECNVDLKLTLVQYDKPTE